MPLHLPQHTQDQLFFDHDMRTDTIDWEYRFQSVLLPSYWSPFNYRNMTKIASKIRSKRRYGKSFKALNF